MNQINSEASEGGRRFENLLESAPGAIVVINLAGQIQMVNARTEELFQYSRDDLIGQPIEMLLPERFQSIHKHHRDSYFESPEQRPMGAGRDLSGRRSNGSEFPVEIGLSHASDEGGVVGIAFIADITERKRAAEALRESGRRFENLLESAPGAIVVIDQQGEIQMVNARTEELFGYSRDMLVGQPIEMLLPERYQSVHRHHRNSYFAAPEQRPMGAGRDLAGRRRDGTEFPIEIGLSYTSDENGYIGIAFIADITERKHTEEERSILLAQVRSANEELEKRVAERTKQLQQSEEKFSKAFETSPAAISIATLPDGRWIEVNDALIKMIGYSREESIGRTSAELGLVDDEARAKILEAIREHGLVRDVEIQIHTKSGQLVDVLVSVEQMELNGQPCALTIQYDITELKRAEREVRRLNQDLAERQVALEAANMELRYQSEVLNSVGDAIMTTGPDFLLRSWNEAAHELFGWAEAEVTGKRGRDLLKPRYVGQTSEEVAQHLLERGSWQGEMSSTHKDGHEVITLASTSAIKDADGVVTGYVSVLRDITERKQIEEALRHERDLMQALMDNLPYMIYFKDAESRFTRINRVQAQLLGVDDPDQVIGKTDFDFQSEEISRVSRAEEQRIMETGEGVVDRIEFNPTADGSPRWITSTKAAIQDPDGQFRNVVGISRDVTQTIQAEEEIKRLNAILFEHATQLESANKELEAFSFSVSHDLRAPLRAIDGFSKIIVEDYGTELPEEALNYLQRVRDNAKYMGQLIDDLLNFSRLSRQPLTRQVTSMQNLIQQVVGEHRAEMDSRQIAISLGELPECEADPALLKQVVVNLLSNAIKYTRRRDMAQIEVGSFQQDGECVYFVRDNGAGFDMRYANKLFGVFQRLHSAEDFEGTGVGLAIVQRIIHRHGGRIWAESEVDCGTTFYFTLALDSQNNSND